MAHNKAGASRRDVLKLAGTSVPAAVVAVTVGTEPAQAAAAEPGDTRLRPTDHVKKYWETARF